MTKDGLRFYTCKRCGCETKENIYRWRKKPQHLKNICNNCIERESLRKQSARERAEDMGYYF